MVSSESLGCDEEFGRDEMMEAENARLETVLTVLRECRGVIAIKLLSKAEKKEILDVESKVEEKIIFGMCKSLNKGVREALQREFTVAMVIQTSEFQYPHHPYMIMVCEDRIIGELVKDPKKVEELRKSPNSFFLWDNFVVYMKKFPRDPNERRKVRIVYLPREPLQLQGVSYVKDSVFGTPSTQGDILIKKMLNVKSKDLTMGTCLVGFNIKE